MRTKGFILAVLITFIAGLFLHLGWAALIIPLLFVGVVSSIPLIATFRQKRTEANALKQAAAKRHLAELEEAAGIPVATDGVCPACGAPLLAGAKFCSMCRTQVAPEPSPARICPKCQTRNLDQAAFCGECGTRLEYIPVVVRKAALKRSAVSAAPSFRLVQAPSTEPSNERSQLTTSSNLLATPEQSQPTKASSTGATVALGSNEQIGNAEHSPTLPKFLIPTEEQEYAEWLAAFPHGHIVNAHRAHAVPMMWHFATCRHIQPRDDYGQVKGIYLKVCSTERDELLAWVRTRPEALGYCRVCGANHLPTK